MFNKVFDRRVYVFLLVLCCSGAVGVTFGFYALWPANVEQGYDPVQPIRFSHALHAGTGTLPDGRMGLEINCRYCHANVDNGPAATVPAVSTCMNCHAQVQTKVLPLHDDHRLEDYVAEQLAWWTGTGHGETSPFSGPADEAHAASTDMTVQHANEAGHAETDAEHGTLPTAPVGQTGGHEAESDEPVLQIDIAKLLWHWENEVPVRWVKVHDLADFAYFDHSRHMAAGLDCVDCHGVVENMDRVQRVYSLKMAWCLDCHRQEPTDITTEQYQEQGLRGPIHCSACHR